MKRKIIIPRLILLICIILCFILLIYFLLLRKPIKKIFTQSVEGFVSSTYKDAPVYDEEFNEVSTLVRGKKIKIDDSEVVDTNNNKYYTVTSEDKKYLIKKDNFTKDKDHIVMETNMFVRTYATVYKKSDTSEILGTVDKGESLDILGYDKLLEDGTVNKYKIKYKDTDGFVYSKYLVNTKEDALKNYDDNGLYKKHTEDLIDPYNVGNAGNLDFYPVEKPHFDDNVMPNEVRAFYMNAGVIYNVDAYIELAKKSNINAFVVDIKDNTSPGYESEVMKKYSPTNYAKAINSFEKYQKAIKKLKDNGFYVIGRITMFKDSYFVSDHPETALLDTATNMPFLHNGSYWPSAFNRYVWEFNVELAKEAVKEMGFNEIQFDYVRFPDGTYAYEADGQMDMRNTYNEEKAQAIQKFLMYAVDEIHAVHAYVSADVFGESAHPYITGYGQYWPAISNVVDVISAMPYPDHFSPHEYKFNEVVWTVPYKLLKHWGGYVNYRQASIPTPAIVRTWIQAYDAVKSPRITYGPDKISEQIEALYETGLTGGYMTWNGNSSLSKYEEISSAFKKEYLNEQNI